MKSMSSPWTFYLSRKKEKIFLFSRNEREKEKGNGFVVVTEGFYLQCR